MKVKGYSYALGLGLAVLLLASPLASLAEEKKSPVKIGGAMRLNYIYGSYVDQGRGEKIGDVDLEIFRLNADLNYDKISGRIEYRWYPRYYGQSHGYSMIHTAWLGYKLGDSGTLKAGIVRVPFGPTAYGVSTSWFFDQHFYVGLADDMDLGIRWTDTFDKLTLDAAYYLTSEPQTIGRSLASSRYAYDIVPWEEKTDADGKVEWGAGENGYDEQHQINLRGIYTLEKVANVGVSIQYGLLKAAEGMDDDGANHYALSAHMKNVISDFTLYSQFSIYAHNIAEETPWGTGDLIPMGAYDFAWPIASKGMIPALSLRYGGIDVSSISWINSVTPYAEWSSIMKSVDNFNNSTLITLGASWTVLGALYVYSDLGLSNGNSFVGNADADGNKEDYANIYTGAGDFGANGNNSWNWRANLNFGYYF
ncbi:MAG: hypothetical protein OXN17_04580 [Candidatus Poribacteria bacterium]|nr:hypothetical protein [Candidatus Poribacteria bacterium]MDE0504331.1 hypothetical protein [Candidatus Poribacteria bacterium]